MSDSETLNVEVILSSVSRNAGGVFDAVRQACAAIMDDKGFRLGVHGVRDDRTEQDLADWAPVPVSAYDRSGPAALAHAPELHKAITRSADIDILHQHGIWQSPSRTALKWRRKTGRPVIISPHGMLDPWALRNSRQKKQVAEFLFEKSNLKGAACLHALNVSELESIRAYGLENPVAIIANGVTLPPASVEPDSKLDEDGRRTLLFLGRIHPKKGLLELITAWKRLKEEAPEVAKGWKLVAAGWDDGGHFEALQASVRDMDLSDDVTLPGAVFGEEKDRLFREASAFVLASHSEGLPMAILEAWAYELPVFMTPACNLPIGFETQAAIALETDPDQIFDALKQNLLRPDLQQFGLNGRKLVSDQFTWTAIGAQFRDLYEWVHAGAEADAAPDFVSL